MRDPGGSRHNQFAHCWNDNSVCGLGNSRLGLSFADGVIILPVAVAISDTLKLVIVCVTVLLMSSVISDFANSCSFIGVVTPPAIFTTPDLGSFVLSSPCLPNFVRQLTGTSAALESTHSYLLSS